MDQAVTFFTETELAGNPLWRCGLAALVAVGLFLALLAIRSLVVSRFVSLAESSESDVDDLFVTPLRRVHALFLLAVALYAGESVLALHPEIDHYVDLALVMAGLVQAGVIVQGFGASSLDLEAIDWVLDRDYAVYMDRQQAVNLGIMRRSEETDLDFAFPAQTLHLESVPQPMSEAMAHVARAQQPKPRSARESHPS